MRDNMTNYIELNIKKSLSGGWKRCMMMKLNEQCYIFIAYMLTTNI